MKHNLTLTDLIVNRDNGKVSIEIVATINRNVIKQVTRPVMVAGTEAVLNEFKSALSGICLQGALYLQNRHIEVFYPSGMTLAEKLSVFDLKQTPTFINDLHSEGFGTNTITAVIW